MDPKLLFQMLFLRVFLYSLLLLVEVPALQELSPQKNKKNNVIPDNDRLSTCYFFSVLQRPVPKFFSVTVPHHRHRCSLHRHRCSTALFAVIAADSPSSTALEFTDFGKL